MNALDATNLAYSKVEKEWSKHPEWNGWLSFQKMMGHYCRRLVRLDGMRLDLEEEPFELERYMKSLK